MKLRLSPLAVFLLAPVNPLLRAEAESSQSACECGKRHLFPAATGNVPGRKYARDRLADIQHVALDVTPDFKLRSVSGTMSMKLTPLGLPLSKFELDAVDLKIASVTSTPPVQEWQNTGEKLVLWFAADVAPGSPIQLTVQFAANPEEGLYFRTPEMGYPATDTQVWSQGEAELHRYWFPCYDYPNERFTSEVKCTVPVGMTVTSNGRLVGQTPAPTEGLTTWHWTQEKPHVNYLIALAAGNFHRIEATAGTVPLALSVPPSLAATAKGAFADTAAIMDFYQKEITVPYPWAKYDQVYVHDFIAGGMENTSCSFMAAAELFPAEVETIDSLQGLDAHEMAHQWFGDLVTCRDWSHLWLNEGFASFYPILYNAHKKGLDAMQEDLWEAAQRVISSSDVRPMVYRDYTDPMQQFDSRAYPKGAWVLNMLRSQLGAELYRKSIAAYLEKHQNTVATSDDLQDVLEEVSGRSFDQFFDQWLHHGGVPELNASQRWEAKEKQLIITIKQSQKVTDQVPQFRLPLPIRCVFPEGKGTPVMQTLIVSQAEENFTITLPEAPSRIELDPDFTVLAKWSGDTTLGDNHAALAGPLHGRIRHIRKLAEDKAPETVNLLKERLAKDTSILARQESVWALEKIATPEAIAVLIENTAEPEAKVRQSILKALAQDLTPAAKASVQARLAIEKNPYLLGDLYTSMAQQPGDAAQTEILKTQVASNSWQNTLSMAAIRALRLRDEESAVASILQKLIADLPAFPQRSTTEAMDALAFLARNQPDPTAVLAFFTEQLKSPRANARVAAAKALGTLGNPKALAVLRSLTEVRKPYLDPARQAAEKSIAQINAKDQGSPPLDRVWQEIQALTKKNQDLENELKKLKQAKPQ